MVTKTCPKCKQHLPVACKNCPCGHVFFVTRRPISIQKSGRNGDGDEGEVKRRRTERTKRERPDFFNPLQMENDFKRLKTLQKARQRTENSTSSSTNDVEGEGEGSNSEEGSTNNSSQTNSTGAKHKKRGRPKKNFTKPGKDESKPVEKEEDMFANLSKEKELQFNIILAEINRKMCRQQFIL